MHSSALALFWKTVCLEDVDVYLAPARSSFSSCSTQFIPVLGLHLSTSSQLVSFIALYFFTSLCVFFFSCLSSISLIFFSVLILFLSASQAVFITKLIIFSPLMSFLSTPALLCIHHVNSFETTGEIQSIGFIY